MKQTALEFFIIGIISIVVCLTLSKNKTAKQLIPGIGVGLVGTILLYFFEKMSIFIFFLSLSSVLIYKDNKKLILLLNAILFLGVSILLFTSGN